MKSTRGRPEVRSQGGASVLRYAVVFLLGPEPRIEAGTTIKSRPDQIHIATSGGPTGSVIGHAPIGLNRPPSG